MMLLPEEWKERFFAVQVTEPHNFRGVDIGLYFPTSKAQVGVRVAVDENGKIDPKELAKKLELAALSLSDYVTERAAGRIE